MDFCRNRSCGIFVFLPSSLAGCQALVSGNLSTRQTAHTVVFLLFFFFPSLWQSSRYGLHLAFCQTVLLLLGILPGSGTAVISVVMFRWSDHDLGRSLSLLCLLAGPAALCGIAWAKYIGRRYFWVPWLLAADPSAPSRWIFGEASRLCREKRGIWEDIYRRLWWPRLLSLGIIPAFWTLPIVDCTLVLWLSERLPIYEKSSIPTSFRQRKIRHFSRWENTFSGRKTRNPRLKREYATLRTGYIK